jgi:hypothetical protein
MWGKKSTVFSASGGLDNGVNFPRQPAAEDARSPDEPCPTNGGMLLANPFTTDKAEISAEIAPRLCGFKGGMCEAKFRRFRVRQQYPTN